MQMPLLQLPSNC